MKYFIQFEGNEKLIIKLILIFLITLILILGKLAFEERPIYVDINTPSCHTE